MVARRTAPTRRANPRAAAKPAPAKRGRPANPARRDLTQYASKPPTGYHKTFAKWLVQNTGLELVSKEARAAFLRGVAMASTLRTDFVSSDALAEYREQTGESKPGRKPAAVPTKKRRPEPEPEPEEEDDDFEDEEEEADDFDDDDEDESDDEDFEDEEEEPAPAPKKRPAARKPTAPARKSAPARKAKPAPVEDDDDEELF